MTKFETTGQLPDIWHRESVLRTVSCKIVFKRPHVHFRHITTKFYASISKHILFVNYKYVLCTCINYDEREVDDDIRVDIGRSFQYHEEYRSNSYSLKTNGNFFGTKKKIHYIIKQNCTVFKNKVAALGSDEREVDDDIKVDIGKLK
jgi:uncharacterized protein YuzE